MKIKIACFSFVAIQLIAVISTGHGDLHEQIKLITKDLRSHPVDARLYLKRGELYSEHSEFAKALTDFKKAETLDTLLHEVHYARGRAYLNAERFKEAIASFDRFLKINPNHSPAYVFRGRSYAEIKQHNQAAKDFETGFEKAMQPEPDLVLERVDALLLVKPARRVEAISALNAGIDKCGSLVSLLSKAADIEVELNYFDQALSRVQLILDQSSRKESWYKRRGEILELAGRKQQARESYLKALSEIDSLPDHLRNAKSMANLKIELNNKLD